MKNILISIIALTFIFSLYLPHKVVGAILVGSGVSGASNSISVSPEQYCRSKYPNSILESLSSDGQATCKCKDGYEWNDNKTSCELPQLPPKTKEPSLLVPPTPKTTCETINNLFIDISMSYNNYYKARSAAGCDVSVPISTREEDQTCQNRYGSNSGWSGKTNEDDGPICECVTGYLYNDVQKTCLLTIPPLPVATATSPTIETVVVQIPIVEIQKPQISNATAAKQIVRVEEKTSTTQESKSVTATTTLKEQATAATTSSTTLIRVEQPRKSIWSRIISWFNF